MNNIDHIKEMKNFVKLSDYFSKTLIESSIIEDSNIEEPLEYSEDSDNDHILENFEKLISKLNNLIDKCESYYGYNNDHSDEYNTGYSDGLSKIAMDLKIIISNFENLK